MSGKYRVEFISVFGTCWDLVLSSKRVFSFALEAMRDDFGVFSHINVKRSKLKPMQKKEQARENDYEITLRLSYY